MLIEMLPKSARADRIKEQHGEVMQIEIANSIFQGKPARLLRSIKKNDDWFGWITEDEADFKIVHFTEYCGM